MKRAPDFASEGALCQAFLLWVKRFDGWTVYAETHDWDILLAHADGTQIGVQAKLKFNMKALQQAVDWSAPSSFPDKPGPDFRAVLLPDQSGAVGLLSCLGLTEFWSHRGGQAFEPALDFRSFATRPWHYCNPVKRHTLPRYLPDVPAGVPSPCALTRWKIAALEIAATIELRGFVTRADFKRAGIDHRRWVREWLEPVLLVDAPGAWRWREGRAAPYQEQHPDVYPQVRTDIAVVLGMAA